MPDLEVTVPGDVPALATLIVTDSAGQARRYVEWGLEGPLTYNPATSLLLDSDSLVVSGFAGALATVTGSYDPNGAGNNAITATTYTTPAAVCGTGDQAHVGVFRIKARVTTASGMMVRFAWRAGDGSMSTNPWTEVGLPSQWVELDLGTITVPVTSSGTQRWTGQIEAYHPTVSGGALSVDYLQMIPTSDGYGVARAGSVAPAGVIALADLFAQTAGALSGKTMDLGGTWATSGGATDFQVTGSGSVTRSIGSETIWAGRFAIAGSSTFTDVRAHIEASGFGDFSTGTATSQDREIHGLVLRYVDSSNWLMVTQGITNTAGFGGFRVVKNIAGTKTVIATGSTGTPSALTGGLSVSIEASIGANGTFTATVTGSNSPSGAFTYTATGQDAALATGGTLATGKVGFYSDRQDSGADTYRFDNFIVSAIPAIPPVIYSGRSMHIRHDDVFRQDSTGALTGRPDSYRGSRFLLPVGTSRVFVKARRNDVESAADDNVTDSTTIQIVWTPRGIAVPRGDS